MSLTQEEIETYAPKLVLTRHTGALLLWFQNSYAFRGTPEQLKPKLISVTVKNLLVGWWSVVSVFINPAVTIGNWFEFNKYSKDYARYITSPEQYVYEARQAEQNGTAKKDRRFKTGITVFIVIATFIALAFVLTILDQSRPPEM